MEQLMKAQLMENLNSSFTRTLRELKPEADSTFDKFAQEANENYLTAYDFAFDLDKGRMQKKHERPKTSDGKIDIEECFQRIGVHMNSPKHYNEFNEKRNYLEYYSFGFLQ